MCLKQPDLCARTFVDFLLFRLKDQHQPSITRSACAAYLASFLARAAFLPHSLVLQALDQLTSFCHDYCKSVTVPAKGLTRSASSNVVLGSKSSAAAALEAEASALSSLTAKHQVLYASVQAILYVLCYHLEPLLQHQPQHQQQQQQQQQQHDTHDQQPHKHSRHHHHHHQRHSMADAVRQLVKERVLPLLEHPLQPLNVCLPSVVAEFKHQVQAAGIADLSHITPPDEVMRQAQRPLEMFFPFDPYLLKRSSGALGLSTSYIRWRHGHPRSSARHGNQGAGSDSEDEEVELEEAEEGEEEGPGGQELDMDNDVHSSSSASSSDDEAITEDGSLKSSVPSDAMLSRPRLKAHASGLPHTSSIPRPLAHHHRHTHHPLGLFHQSMRVAGGGKQAHGGGSYDPMGTSYSPGSNTHGNPSSSNGGSPPLGSSPLVVDYHRGVHGGGSLYAQSLSPMQMGTPPIHHMHAHLHARQTLPTVATHK
ncbi:RNA polymerase I-specific transcription initiation factor RRN3-domain-containing protein [Dunaliella salina]|nr:RNA polymerase I-specific transcription initiation factor RRN3-domain-containing protein [Dunaliella salina]|eukprot:KAF5828417.1 RNA polymerase I-specific transcription initiation factor RRN3-domain-containing protein [Dunaliella salina]